MAGGLQLPDGLAKLFYGLTGSPWFRADEVLLMALADVFDGTGSRFEREVPPVIDAVKRRVRSTFDSRAADHYEESINQFTSGKNNYVQTTADACYQMADFLRVVAKQVRYTKEMVIAQLVQLKLEIAWAIANAKWSFGATLGMIPIFERIASLAIQRIINFLISTLLAHITINVALAMTMDQLIQMRLIKDDYQDTNDNKLSLDAAVGGLLDGLFGAVLSGAGKEISDRITNNFGDILKINLRDSGPDPAPTPNTARGLGNDALAPPPRNEVGGPNSSPSPDGGPSPKGDRDVETGPGPSGGPGRSTDDVPGGGPALVPPPGRGADGTPPPPVRDAPPPPTRDAPPPPGAGGRDLPPTFIDDVSRVFARNTEDLMRPFGRTPRPWDNVATVNRFRDDMGKVFADNFGDRIGREAARDLGRDYADTFAANWGRRDIGDSLARVLDDAPGGPAGRLSPDVNAFLSRNLPEGIGSSLSEFAGNWRRMAAELAINPVEGAASNVLGEGFSNLILSPENEFKVTGMTAVAGASNALLTMGGAMGGVKALDGLENLFASKPGGPGTPTPLSAMESDPVSGNGAPGTPGNGGGSAYRGGPGGSGEGGGDRGNGPDDRQGPADEEGIDGAPDRLGLRDSDDLADDAPGAGSGHRDLPGAGDNARPTPPPEAPGHPAPGELPRTEAPPPGVTEYDGSPIEAPRSERPGDGAPQGADNPAAPPRSSVDAPAPLRAETPSDAGPNRYPNAEPTPPPHADDPSLPRIDDDAVDAPILDGNTVDGPGEGAGLPQGGGAMEGGPDSDVPPTGSGFAGVPPVAATTPPPGHGGEGTGASRPNAAAPRAGADNGAGRGDGTSPTSPRPTSGQDESVVPDDASVVTTENGQDGTPLPEGSPIPETVPSPMAMSFADALTPPVTESADPAWTDGEDAASPINAAAERGQPGPRPATQPPSPTPVSQDPSPAPNRSPSARDDESQAEQRAHSDLTSEDLADLYDSPPAESPMVSQSVDPGDPWQGNPPKSLDLGALQDSKGGKEGPRSVEEAIAGLAVFRDAITDVGASFENDQWVNLADRFDHSYADEDGYGGYDDSSEGQYQPGVQTSWDPTQVQYSQYPAATYDVSAATQDEQSEDSAGETEQAQDLSGEAITLWNGSFAGIADLVVATRTVAEREVLNYGGPDGSTELMRFANGAQAVYKNTGENTDSLNRADAEQLGSLVGRAIGANVPGVLRLGENRLLMHFMSGESGYIHDDNPQSPLTHTWDGHVLGLLDLLIANDDRNPGNWLDQGNGRIAGIDHGSAWFRSEYTPEDPTDLSTMSNTDAMRPFYDFDGNVWIVNPLTRADIRWLRTRLAPLRPEFDRLGRTAWFDEMMARLDMLDRHARGTISLLVRDSDLPGSRRDDDPPAPGGGQGGSSSSRSAPGSGGGTRRHHGPGHGSSRHGGHSGSGRYRRHGVDDTPVQDAGNSDQEIPDLIADAAADARDEAVRLRTVADAARTRAQETAAGAEAESIRREAHAAEVAADDAEYFADLAERDARTAEERAENAPREAQTAERRVDDLAGGVFRETEVEERAEIEGAADDSGNLYDGSSVKSRTITESADPGDPWQGSPPRSLDLSALFDSKKGPEGAMVLPGGLADPLGLFSGGQPPLQVFMALGGEGASSPLQPTSGEGARAVPPGLTPVPPAPGTAHPAGPSGAVTAGQPSAGPTSDGAPHRFTPPAPAPVRNDLPSPDTWGAESAPQRRLLSRNFIETLDPPGDEGAFDSSVDDMSVDASQAGDAPPLTVEIDTPNGRMRAEVSIDNRFFESSTIEIDRDGDEAGGPSGVRNVTLRLRHFSGNGVDAEARGAAVEGLKRRIEAVYNDQYVLPRDGRQLNVSVVEAGYMDPQDTVHATVTWYPVEAGADGSPAGPDGRGVGEVLRLLGMLDGDPARGVAEPYVAELTLDRIGIMVEPRPARRIPDPEGDRPATKYTRAEHGLVHASVWEHARTTAQVHHVGGAHMSADFADVLTGQSDRPAGYLDHIANTRRFEWRRLEIPPEHRTEGGPTHVMEITYRHRIDDESGMTDEEFDAYLQEYADELNAMMNYQHRLRGDGSVVNADGRVVHRLGSALLETLFGKDGNPDARDLDGSPVTVPGADPLAGTGDQLHIRLELADDTTPADQVHQYTTVHRYDPSLPYIQQQMTTTDWYDRGYPVKSRVHEALHKLGLLDEYPEDGSFRRWGDDADAVRPGPGVMGHGWVGDGEGGTMVEVADPWIRSRDIDTIGSVIDRGSSAQAPLKRVADLSAEDTSLITAYLTPGASDAGRVFAHFALAVDEHARGWSNDQGADQFIASPADAAARGAVREQVAVADGARALARVERARGEAARGAGQDGVADAADASATRLQNAARAADARADEAREHAAVSGADARVLRARDAFTADVDLWRADGRLAQMMFFVSQSGVDVPFRAVVDTLPDAQRMRLGESLAGSHDPVAGAEALAVFAAGRDSASGSGRIRDIPAAQGHPAISARDAESRLEEWRRDGRLLGGLHVLSDNAIAVMGDDWTHALPGPAQQQVLTLLSPYQAAPSATPGTGLGALAPPVAGRAVLDMLGSAYDQVALGASAKDIAVNVPGHPPARFTDQQVYDQLMAWNSQGVLAEALRVLQWSGVPITDAQIGAIAPAVAAQPSGQAAQGPYQQAPGAWGGHYAPGMAPRSGATQALPVRAADDGAAHQSPVPPAADSTPPATPDPSDAPVSGPPVNHRPGDPAPRATGLSDPGTWGVESDPRKRLFSRHLVETLTPPDDAPPLTVEVDTPNGRMRAQVSIDNRFFESSTIPIDRDGDDGPSSVRNVLLRFRHVPGNGAGQDAVLTAAEGFQHQVEAVFNDAYVLPRSGAQLNVEVIKAEGSSSQDSAPVHATVTWLPVQASADGSPPPALGPDADGQGIKEVLRRLGLLDGDPARGVAEPYVARRTLDRIEAMVEPRPARRFSDPERDRTAQEHEHVGVVDPDDMDPEVWAAARAAAEVHQVGGAHVSPESAEIQRDARVARLEYLAEAGPQRLIEADMGPKWVVPPRFEWRRIKIPEEYREEGGATHIREITFRPRVTRDPGMTQEQYDDYLREYRDELEFMWNVRFRLRGDGSFVNENGEVVHRLGKDRFETLFGKGSEPEAPDLKGKKITVPGADPLPGTGDQVHVRLELAGDTTPADDVHAEVTLRHHDPSQGAPPPMDMDNWHDGFSAAVAVHEGGGGHRIGLPDTYQDARSVFRSSADANAVRPGYGVMGNSWMDHAGGQKIAEPQILTQYLDITGSLMDRDSSDYSPPMRAGELSGEVKWAIARTLEPGLSPTDRRLAGVFDRFALATDRVLRGWDGSRVADALVSPEDAAVRGAVREHLSVAADARGAARREHERADAARAQGDDATARAADTRAAGFETAAQEADARADEARRRAAGTGADARAADAL
ncbi:hypothetical protein ACFO4E_29055, partial [Nocardiopsis mangrovi]